MAHATIDFAMFQSSIFEISVNSVVMSFMNMLENLTQGCVLRILLCLIQELTWSIASSPPMFPGIMMLLTPGGNEFDLRLSFEEDFSFSVFSSSFPLSLLVPSVFLSFPVFSSSSGLFKLSFTAFISSLSDWMSARAANTCF